MEMKIDGEPLTDDELHIIYAIGRRNNPTKSDIAPGLCKVGIGSPKRIKLINRLIKERILKRKVNHGIGVLGRKPTVYSLDDVGKQIFERMFSESSKETEA